MNFNLDAMSPDDLMDFWAKHQGGRAYRALAPQGGKGAKRAAADLANYASNKATAMRCRLKGEIQTAQNYERIADAIYNQLPASAKW